MYLQVPYKTILFAIIKYFKCSKNKFFNFFFGHEIHSQIFKFKGLIFPGGSFHREDYLHDKILFSGVWEPQTFPVTPGFSQPIQLGVFDSNFISVPFVIFCQLKKIIMICKILPEPFFPGQKNIIFYQRRASWKYQKQSTHFLIINKWIQKKHRKKLSLFPDTIQKSIWPLWNIKNHIRWYYDFFDQGYRRPKAINEETQIFLTQVIF